MRFLQEGLSALASGNVVWGSGVISGDPYPKIKVIAKNVDDGRVIIFKMKAAAEDDTYDAVSPECAIELGEALSAGAERLMEGRN